MFKSKFCKLIIFFIPLFFFISCSKQSKNEAQGYIEGRYTYMATPVSGVLESWLVARGSEVKKGDLLFILEEQPEIDQFIAAAESLKASVAARDAIIANLSYAKVTYERYKTLVPKKAIEQAALDNAKSTYDATQAQLNQANATIAEATATMMQMKWTKDQKKVYAPVDAIVFDTYYRLGEFTIAKEAVLSLLAPADIKAIFYVQEAILGSFHLRQAVHVRCDGCTKTFEAHISFISPTAEYTPPVIFSTETSPKLIYRIEADFSPNDAKQMHPGQPVRVLY